MSKIRTFLAIEIPSEIIEQIIIKRNQLLFDDRVNWERKEKLHITLKFFGEIEEKLLGNIKNILEEVVVTFSPVIISFSNFGFFIRDGVPKILYLGISRNNELKKIFHILEARFEKIGIPKEQRNFNPHLTLLRIKTFEESLKNFENKICDNLSFECKSLSLMKSELNRSGSIYTRINKYYFKEA